MKGTIPISVDTFLDRLLGNRVLAGGAQTRQQAMHYAYQSVKNCGNYLMHGGDVMLHFANANANDDWDNVDLKRVERLDEARNIWHNDPIRQQYMALPEDQRKNMEQMNESFADSRNRTWSQWFTYQKNWVYEQMTWQNIGVSIFLFLIVYYNVDEETDSTSWWIQPLRIIKRIFIKFVETATELYHTLRGLAILGMNQTKSLLTTGMTLGQAKKQAKLEDDAKVRTGAAGATGLGVAAYCLVAANPFSAVASGGLGPASCVSSVAALTVGYVSYEWRSTLTAKTEVLSTNKAMMEQVAVVLQRVQNYIAANPAVGGAAVTGFLTFATSMMSKTQSLHLRKAEALYQAYGTTMETAAAVLNPAAGVAVRGIRTATDIPRRIHYTQEDREFGDQVRRQLDTVAHTTRGKVQGMLKKQQKGRKARGARIKSKRAEQQRRIKNRRKVEKDYDEDVYDEDAYDPWDEDYGDVYSADFDRAPRRSPRLRQRRSSPRKKRSHRRTSANPVQSRRRKRTKSRTRQPRSSPRRSGVRRNSPRRRKNVNNVDVNLDTPIPMGPTMAGGADANTLRQLKLNILRTEQKNGRDLSTRRSFNHMLRNA